MSSIDLNYFDDLDSEYDNHITFETLHEFPINEYFSVIYNQDSDIWTIEGTEPENGEEIVLEIDPDDFEDIANELYELTQTDFNEHIEIVKENI